VKTHIEKNIVVSAEGNEQKRDQTHEQSENRKGFKDEENCS